MNLFGGILGNDTIDKIMSPAVAGGASSVASPTVTTSVPVGVQGSVGLAPGGLTLPVWGTSGGTEVSSTLESAPLTRYYVCGFNYDQIRAELHHLSARELIYVTRPDDLAGIPLGTPILLVGEYWRNPDFLSLKVKAMERGMKFCVAMDVDQI